MSALPPDKLEEQTELDRWSAALPDRRVIKDFLAWCDEQDLTLCEWRPGGRFNGVPTIESRNRLLNRYHGIDVNRLDQERRALLEQAREVSRG